MVRSSVLSLTYYKLLVCVSSMLFMYCAKLWPHFLCLHFQLSKRAVLSHKASVMFYSHRIIISTRSNSTYNNNYRIYISIKTNIRKCLMHVYNYIINDYIHRLYNTPGAYPGSWVSISKKLQEYM